MRGALVAKYGCCPNSELELHVWRPFIIEELGGDPSDWNSIRWSGIGSAGAEAVGSGWRCARLLHTAGPPGHFVPVWVEGPETTGGPGIRAEEPEVPGETKPERDRRLARNRKVRASNRLAAETP